MQIITSTWQGVTVEVRMVTYIPQKTTKAITPALIPFHTRQLKRRPRSCQCCCNFPDGFSIYIKHKIINVLYNDVFYVNNGMKIAITSKTAYQHKKITPMRKYFKLLLSDQIYPLYVFYTTSLNSNVWETYSSSFQENKLWKCNIVAFAGSTASLLYDGPFS